MAPFPFVAASLSRKVAFTAVVLLGVGLVVGAGSYLSTTQSNARKSVLSAFDQRAQLASGVVGDTLLASDPKLRQLTAGALSGPVAGLDAALTTMVDSTSPWAVVLDVDGTPMGVSSPQYLALAETLHGDTGFRVALQTGKLTFGDFQTDGGTPTVHYFLPYAVGGSLRVYSGPMDVPSLKVMIHSAIDIAGSRSYVVDSAGRLIVTSTDVAAGAAIPDAGLATVSARSGRGTVGDDYFVATAVAGTSWRAVIATSRAGLLAAVDSTAHSAWLIFGAFVAAVVLSLVIGAGTLISSARLAHARLHDALTALPGRSLFLEKLEAAVQQWRRGESGPGGLVAVVFLDLDGFKPVNDTYGHAAGDALLKAVSQRLVAATRPEDFVSRFGGDEFLVLCRGLREEADACAVAERIRKDLTQPYEVLGHEVRVGTSIGIATVGEYADRAETLINNADLALYQAKNNGRGRIERFHPGLVKTNV